MLEIRPSCENCGKDLPPDSTEAMICSFECTFCRDCVENVLFNVCPNCGGGLVVRPIRPREKLETSPASTRRVTKTVDRKAHARLLVRYRDVPPEAR